MVRYLWNNDFTQRAIRVSAVLTFAYVSAYGGHLLSLYLWHNAGMGWLVFVPLIVVPSVVYIVSGWTPNIPIWVVIFYVWLALSVLFGYLLFTPGILFPVASLG